MICWIFTIVWMCIDFVLWFSSFSPSERAALAAAFLVFVGVAGEYVAEVDRVRRKPQAEKWVKKVSMTLLLVGLAGDGLGIVMGQAEMTTLTKETGSAKKAADGAVADFEQAKGELSALDQKATGISNRLDAASSQVARLEERLAWRSVSDWQKKKLKTELKNFRGRRIAITWEAEDPEQEAFAPKLLKALRYAGLQVDAAPAGINLTPAELASNGILIEGDNPVLNEGLAKALVLALLARKPVPILSEHIGNADAQIRIRVRIP